MRKYEEKILNKRNNQYEMCEGEFADVVNYMQQHDCKLEQEAIDFYTKDIRAEIENKRRLLSLEEVSVKSRLINDRLQELLVDIIATQENIAFFTYYPLDNEVNLNETTNWLLARGKAVYYPVSHKGGIMDFYQVHSLDELSEGRFHVMEPKREKANLFIPEEHTDTRVIVLTPGVVFDKNGNRMGHGMGYYDRYFERLKNIMSTHLATNSITNERPMGTALANTILGRENSIIKIGIAYDLQIVDHMETKPWDVKMDMMISESSGKE